MWPSALVARIDSLLCSVRYIRLKHKRSRKLSMLALEGNLFCYGV